MYLCPLPTYTRCGNYQTFYLEVKSFSVVTRVDPLHDLILQHRQRSHRAQDDLVKLLDIKLLSQAALSQFPQLDDLQLTDLEKLCQ